MTTAANRVHVSLVERAPQVAMLRGRYDAHKLRLLERVEAKAEAHAPKVPPDKKALLADILARAKARG